MLKKKPVMFLIWAVLGMISASVAAAGGVTGNSQTKPQAEILSLDQCLRLAAQNSQQVKIAAKNTAKAREGVKQAQAGFWPSLDYQAGVQHESQASIYAWPGGIPLYGRQQGFGVSVTVTQPLYTGGKLQTALKLARLQLNAALEEERKAKQNLAYSVKEAFFQVWVAAKILRVAEDSLHNMDRHVIQVQSLKKVGTASKYEVSRAVVQRDSLKPAVIKAENAVALAKLGLATLIGIDKDREFGIAYDADQVKLPEQIGEIMETALQSAYSDRPEIREMAQLKQIAVFKRQLAEAEYKPNLVLTGNYQGGDIPAGQYGDLVTFTLAVKGNLNSGGATRAQVASARDDEEIAALQESGLKDQIRLQIRQAIQALREGLATLKANQSNISLAKDTLKYTQSRFDVGLATTMDIMDSQLALDQALNGYYQGIASYLIAMANLDLVKGAD